MAHWLSIESVVVRPADTNEKRRILPDSNTRPVSPALAYWPLGHGVSVPTSPGVEAPLQSP